MPPTLNNTRVCVIRGWPLALILLAGCVAVPPKDGKPPLAVPAVQGNAAVPDPSLDASYDWHGLVIIPFGTLLSASKIALHEVLLFHDRSRTADGLDNKDCYTVDAAPRFVDQRLEEYLLCFGHDRLNRIDAAVRLGTSGAAQTFARACGLWRKESLPLPPKGNSCEGRDGTIAFSAHLTEVEGEPSSLLSVTLGPPAPEELGGATPAP